MDKSTEKAPQNRFWEEKTLAEMTEAEWESLCDGCGRCCIMLLEDETGEETGFLETSICCKLFDPKKRTCTQYADRQTLVPDCVRVTPQNAGELTWMPETCAYRRLARGEGLADWHPLISGSRKSVVTAGIAVGADLTPEPKVRARHYYKYVVGLRFPS